MSLNCPLINRFPNPVCWLKTAANRPRRTLLFTATEISLTGVTWLCLSNLGATLELPHNVTSYQHLAQTPLTSPNQAALKVLLVNPSAANGNNADGSESAPFKTITQALQVAEPNSVIILSTGTYSTSSGETFPLKLKPSVSIQGDPKTKGSNIVISGGGTFMSPTFARQDITILGANGASLTGVTVTNSNPRGYGLWIESSSPTVSENTFTGSNHDGISITGNSAPIIHKNYFHQNGANGITIYGKSRPEVRENVFEKTGFGINISQTAAPLLIGNRIINNRSGIVSQANSKPVLRNNEIEGNTEDGVVAIAASRPDLGTKTEPGGNVFRQNGRYDINSSAAGQLISAVGNQLARDRSNGNIDLAGTGSPTITIADKPPVNTQVALNPTPASPKQEQEISAENSTLQQKTPSEPTKEPPRNTTAIEIPVPPPESTKPAKPKPSRGSAPKKLNLVENTKLKPNQSVNRVENGNKPPLASGGTIIKVPTRPKASQPPVAPPPPKNGSLTQGLPVLQPAPLSDLLPVPSADIPFGSNRNQPQQIIARSAPDAGSPPLPPTRATALGLRYRVVVEAENESLQAKVRSLVPGAFRIFANGRAIMQAGAFSDRAEADEVLQLLTSNGFKAAIEQLN